MRVLVAHGSEKARQAVLAALAGLDVETGEAVDGSEALDVMLHDDQVQVALIEWDLPVLDGLELSEVVRDVHPGRAPHVILMTRAAAGRDVTTGLLAGAHDFVLTPASPQELQARVRFGLAAQELDPGPGDVCDAFSRIDALTGLASGVGILHRLEVELARSLRDRASLGIGLLDIDGLEALNRRHGREAGDAIIREVGRRLRNTMRPYDGIGRLGGGEFLIVIPRTSESDVGEALGRVRAAIVAEPLLHGDERVEFTVTLGGATGSEESAEALLAGARKALAEAKAEGGDRVVAGAKVELEAVISDQWRTTFGL